MISGLFSSKLSSLSGCNPQCNACRHKHMTFIESFAQKQAFAHKILSGFGVVEQIEKPPENKLKVYRKKVLLSAAYQHQWIIGTRRKDTVIAVHECPVHHPGVNAVIQFLSNIMPPFSEFPMVFFSMNGAQIALVLKTNEQPNTQWLTSTAIEQLMSLGVEGLHLHLHSSAGNKVFGKVYWKTIFGNNFSLDEQGFLYGPLSFQQQISELRDKAHRVVLDFFMPQDTDLFMDLYCGTGMMLRKMSDKGIQQLLGIEISGESVHFSELNAPNAHILRGTCLQRKPQAEDWISQHKTDNSNLYVFVNPPRTGLGLDICQWLSEIIHPGKIAYLSCSPGTLSKDLEILVKNGFKIIQIKPFDFFPGTHHIENLVTLTGNK